MSVFVYVLIGLFLDWFLLGWWLNVPIMWPSIIWHIFWTSSFTFASAFLHNGIKDDYFDLDTENKAITAPLTVACVALVIAILIGMFAGVFNASALRNLGNVEVSDQKIEVADIQHIRVVPKESAEWIGNQVIGKGNLGSIYHPGEYNVQQIHGTLYWAAPLEFNSFMSWFDASGGISTSYIKVNAEDINAPAELVEGQKMRFLSSAWFGNNISRYIYFSGYWSYKQSDPVFEVNDEGKSFIVVALSRPSVGFTGDVLKKVAIVNTETGEISTYLPDETPEWVDQAFPMQFALDRANWWGRYVHGYGNTIPFFGSHLDQTTVSQSGVNNIQDVFLVHNKLTSRPVWINGMTSASSTDNAMTGLMTTDSVNGKMTFYPINSVGNEKAVIGAVEAAPDVSIQKSYHAAQPIIYNIYGEDSWVVPVLSTNHITEKVAIVYAKDTRHVAIGNTKAEALNAYKNLLVSIRAGGVVPSESEINKQISGKVSRIVLIDTNGNLAGYIILDELPSRQFQVPRSVSEEIVNSRDGDLVTMSYVDTTEGTVPVRKFDNLSLSFAKSDEQQVYDDKQAATTAKTIDELKKEQLELQRKADEINQKIQGIN